MQITWRGAERQFCVSDLSGSTAGARSASAPGHQSGFVNFLHIASQLLSPPNTDFSCASLRVEMDYKMIGKVDLLYLKNTLFSPLNLHMFGTGFTIFVISSIKV